MLVHSLSVAAAAGTSIWQRRFSFEIPRNGEDSADSRGLSRTGDQPSSGVIVGRLAEMVSPDD
jgi:hypothetical protein